MPTVSSKHPKREKKFSFQSFHGGLNKDIAPTFLPVEALSRCNNLKYVMTQLESGQKVVTLKKRQGATVISNTALPAAADVLNCTKYLAQSQYILATAAKIYKLDGSFDPVEIGSISGVPTFTEFKGKLIIHDSGVTKAWDGTTFETLAKGIQDEVIGTGDNAETEFSDTLDNPAATASTLTISYTDTTAKTVTDDGKGRLTGDIAAGVVKNITGASQASPCSITCVAHGYSTGDIINIQSVVGMTEINDLSFTITIAGADNFTIGVNSTAYTAYTSGGTASSNAIIYSTGVLLLTCSGAPDNGTSLTASYDKTNGAPKSRAGFVRGSRLYMWGDSDNTSRLWYSGANDEDGWDSSSSGGYLDCDLLDGYALNSCLNYFQSILLLKENSLHRLDNFPGDETFQIEPLISDLGSKSYRATLNDGEIISFMASGGWVAMTPSERYGDIQKHDELSKKFNKEIAKYINANAYAEYNQLDKQLWITLHDGSNHLTDIRVINLATGGQLSIYKFAFTHSCYKYVDNEMLIGGTDGNLYKLVDDESVFTDNLVSYSDSTFCRSAFSNFELPFNKKHNKKICAHVYGASGITANLKLYKDQDYGSFTTIAITTAVADAFINPDGKLVYIYDMTSGMGAFSRQETVKERFNYEELMFEITDIAGTLGAEIYGIDFFSAITGQ